MDLFKSACLFSACQKEEVDMINTEIIEEGELVDINLYGTVVDENKIPIEGALVSVDNHSTITNENGIYHFEAIQAYGPRVKVSIQHQDYFKMFETVQVDENIDYKLGVRMTSLSEAINFSAFNGDEITFEDGVNKIPNKCF